MGNIKGRLDKIEQSLEPAGKVIVLYGDDSPDGDGQPDPQAVAKARAEMRPNDILIKVCYGDWPPGGSPDKAA